VPTFYVDETGFTGEDLLAREQPLFVQATNNYTADEADQIIRDAFGRINAAELKYTRLARGGRHEDHIVECVRIITSDPARAGTWVAHKEFAMVTFLVDWWMEPLAYQAGVNLYQDGGNCGTANMLFMCLEGFWSVEFRQKLLLHFQRMFRARTRERFAECESFMRRERSKVSDNALEVLGYLWHSFRLLGYGHVVGLPKHVLDLALPGLVLIGHKWRERHDGPWEAVLDQSSMMAKQKWLWEELSSPQVAEARFEYPHSSQAFPMNVSGTRFADSLHERQIQICDVLAGATVACLRTHMDDSKRGAYSDKLIDAGIEKLTIGGIWPSQDVTPEALGTKGWDGNEAIEWIAEELARQRGRRDQRPERG